MSLTERMGTTAEDPSVQEAGVQILMPLLSLPEELRRVIEVNLEDASYRLTDPAMAKKWQRRFE